MSERLEVDALRALRAISLFGGVTRAADHLALSQSAVSHKIRRLERALDCTLLTRRAGGPLFTDAGLRLLEYAHRMTNLHDEALASLGTKPLSGTIKLGMTEDTTLSRLSRVLGRFTRLYPDIQVNVRTSQSLVAQERLRTGALDLAVMQIFDSDLRPEDQHLFSDTLHWVKSPDFPLETDAPVPFLSFDAACFYKQWGLAQGAGNGPRLRNVFECPSAAGIQSAVRAGLGVALLNGMHVTRDMEVIEGEFPVPPPLYYVCRVGAGRQSPAVRALTNAFRDEASSAAEKRVRA